MAAKPDMVQGFFEAKKWAYRQTQDGIVASFLIHPNDLNAEFAVAPLGTQYMVAFAAIGEDGAMAVAPIPQGQGSGGAKVKRERIPFSVLPLPQQAALRCNDKEFQHFLSVNNPEKAAQAVREECGVSSRRDLKPGTPGAKAWLSLEQTFQAWLTDCRYAETIR